MFLIFPGQPRIRSKTWIDGTGQPQAGVYELFELPAQRQGRTTDQHLCVHRECYNNDILYYVFFSFIHYCYTYIKKSIFETSSDMVFP